MKTYGRADAETIIGDYFTNVYDIRDDGVWPTKVDGNWILSWCPAIDLNGPDAPNALETPNLPFPFNANQLAAFMLDGVGAGLASVYGAWASGPDKGTLDSLDERANGSKEVLVDAYEAYRAAENVVGRLNVEFSSDEYAAAYPLWRKAMVRQLLNPVARAACTPDAPSSVVAESASVTHSTKTRRDALAPVIELAQQQCRNPGDVAEVWGALQVLAEKKEKPLLGATEDGLQYLKGGTAVILTRNALKQRLTRATGNRR